MSDDPAERVQQTLDDLLPGTRVVTLPRSTHTAPEAAAAVGCELGAIVKSLVFLVRREPVLVLCAGDGQVSDQKLGAHFGAGRKQIAMATPAAVLDLTGYQVGGVPPLGLRQALPVLIDRSLERFGVVYAAAGTPYAIFAAAPAELCRATDGTVLDVIR